MAQRAREGRPIPDRVAKHMSQGTAVYSLEEERPEMQERAMLALEAHEAMSKGVITDLDEDLTLQDMMEHIGKEEPSPEPEPRGRSCDSADARGPVDQQSRDSADAEE